jgi:hypothetical protein
MDNSIIDDFPEEVDKVILKELFEEYKGIKKSHYTQNFELTLTRLGRFVETLFLLLSAIALKERPKEIKIYELMKKLENLSDESQNVSIRVIIPRIAHSLYTIRSKRGSVHKSDEVSPNEIDSKFVLCGCNWIICELIRLHLKKEPPETVKILNDISRIPLPCIEEIKGDIVLLKGGLKAKDQILIYLLHIYPNAVSRSDIEKFVKGQTKAHITLAINRLKEDRLLHEKEELYFLTATGVNEAERIVFGTNHASL